MSLIFLLFLYLFFFSFSFCCCCCCCFYLRNYIFQLRAFILAYTPELVSHITSVNKWKPFKIDWIDLVNTLVKNGKRKKMFRKTGSVSSQNNWIKERAVIYFLDNFHFLCISVIRHGEWMVSQSQTFYYLDIPVSTTKVCTSYC